MNTSVYLDYNATARVRPEVIDVVSATLRETGNASSIHAAGRSARQIVEEARREVASLAGAPADNVVFVSGGTEANNQIMARQDPGSTLISEIEHPAVSNSCPGARRVGVDAHGLVDQAALAAQIAAAPNTNMIAVMLANNETGVIQPISHLVEIARRHDALVHCDAVQAGGKIPLDFRVLGVDTMALSAHKLGGPQGVGALVFRDENHIARFMHGGGQERGLRAGTEAVALIAGFGLAARLARDSLADYGKLGALRDHMENSLAAAEPGFRVFGNHAPRLPNTSQCMMPGVSSETQLMAFDLEGIAISAGSACSAGRIDPPYVLTAMGVPDHEALSAVRVSLGWDTQPADIERFIEAWKRILARSRTRDRKVA